VDVLSWVDYIHSNMMTGKWQLMGALLTSGTAIEQLISQSIFTARCTSA